MAQNFINICAVRQLKNIMSHDAKNFVMNLNDPDVSGFVALFSGVISICSIATTCNEIALIVSIFILLKVKL